MYLKIPKDFVSGFSILKDLPIDEVKKIALFISAIPSGTGPKEFHSFFTKEYEKDELSQLSSTIYSFGSLLLRIDESLEEISKMLYKAYLKTIDCNDVSEKSNDLEEKLLIILRNSDNLKFTFKALELISDNEIIYKNGRVFSDLRLLFNEVVKENKSNRKAVIIHNLKIESHKNGNNKDFYFSLDSKDLYKMKEIINRAIIKDKQIKSDYSNIEFIEVTE